MPLLTRNWFIGVKFKGVTNTTRCTVKILINCTVWWREQLVAPISLDGRAVCVVITSTSAYGHLVLGSVWRRITKRTTSMKPLQWPYIHSLRIPVFRMNSLFTHTLPV